MIESIGGLEVLGRNVVVMGVGALLFVHFEGLFDLGLGVLW